MGTVRAGWWLYESRGLSNRYAWEQGNHIPVFGNQGQWLSYFHPRRQGLGREGPTATVDADGHARPGRGSYILTFLFQTGPLRKGADYEIRTGVINKADRYPPTELENHASQLCHCVTER